VLRFSYRNELAHSCFVPDYMRKLNARSSILRTRTFRPCRSGVLAVLRWIIRHPRSRHFRQEKPADDSRSILLSPTLWADFTTHSARNYRAACRGRARARARAPVHRYNITGYNEGLPRCALYYRHDIIAVTRLRRPLRSGKIARCSSRPVLAARGCARCVAAMRGVAKQQSRLLTKFPSSIVRRVPLLCPLTLKRRGSPRLRRRFYEHLLLEPPSRMRSDIAARYTRSVRLIAASGGIEVKRIREFPGTQSIE